MAKPAISKPLDLAEELDAEQLEICDNLAKARAVAQVTFSEEAPSAEMIFGVYDRMFLPMMDEGEEDEEDSE